MVLSNWNFDVQESTNLCLNEVYRISIFKQHCNNKFKFLVYFNVISPV